MEIGDKIELLAASARYDAPVHRLARDLAGRGRVLGAASPAGVCHSWTGDGRCVSLLKVLYSNSCRNDCAYCANRVRPRSRGKPPPPRSSSA